MSLTLVTPPAVEPVTLEAMKAHLRLDTDYEDVPLAAYASAARALVEARTGRALITQTWCLRLDAWPLSRLVCLPRAPVQTVDRVTVFDREGTGTNLATDSYDVDTRSSPGRLYATGAALWPVPARALDGIEIIFTAGYGADGTAVPPPLIHAIKLLAAHYFEARAITRPPDALEAAITALLGAHMPVRL